MKYRIVFYLEGITMYDYLIVGAGLSGAIFAPRSDKRGKSKSNR